MGIVGVFCVTLVCKQIIKNVQGEKIFFFPYWDEKVSLGFCGLAFCFLLKLFARTKKKKKKGSRHGERSTIFPAFAPFPCPSAQRALILTSCLCRAQCQVSSQQKCRLFAVMNMKATLCLSLASMAAVKGEAGFTGWRLPDPKPSRVS